MDRHVFSELHCLGCSQIGFNSDSIMMHAGTSKLTLAEEREGVMPLNKKISL
jgi:hypothetical protein